MSKNFNMIDPLGHKIRLFPFNCQKMVFIYKNSEIPYQMNAFKIIIAFFAASVFFLVYFLFVGNGNTIIPLALDTFSAWKVEKHENLYKLETLLNRCTIGENEINCNYSLENENDQLDDDILKIHNKASISIESVKMKNQSSFSTDEIEDVLTNSNIVSQNIMTNPNLKISQIKDKDEIYYDLYKTFQIAGNIYFTTFPKEYEEKYFCMSYRIEKFISVDKILYNIFINNNNGIFKCKKCTKNLEKMKILILRDFYETKDKKCDEARNFVWLYCQFHPTTTKMKTTGCLAECLCPQENKEQLK